MEVYLKLELRNASGIPKITTQILQALLFKSTETQHAINFDQNKILASAVNCTVRKIIVESIVIRKKHNFNRDGGFVLSITSKPVIQKLN